MDDDIIIDTAQACGLMNKARAENVLLLWVVTHGSTDYPRGYVARPQFASKDEVSSLRHVLLAETLADIRAKLPPGLCCLGRQDGDEQQIVEVWV